MKKWKTPDLLPLQKHLKLNKCVFMIKISDGHTPIYLFNLFQHTKLHEPELHILPQPRIDLFKSSLSFSRAVLLEFNTWEIETNEDIDLI